MLIPRAVTPSDRIEKTFQPFIKYIEVVLLCILCHTSPCVKEIREKVGPIVTPSNFYSLSIVMMESGVVLCGGGWKIFLSRESVYEMSLIGRGGHYF